MPICAFFAACDICYQYITKLYIYISLTDCERGCLAHAFALLCQKMGANEKRPFVPFSASAVLFFEFPFLLHDDSGGSCRGLCVEYGNKASVLQLYG